MRFSFSAALVAVLAADAAIASSWFGKTAYNKWHETELERWLSDNNIPYPTPADRKDLESLIKENWNDKVVTPYNSWDTNQLQKYITSKGQQVQKGTEKNKKSLIEQVTASWTDTEEKIAESYANTRDWIFDSWTDSQLKAFADKQGIPVPQPRTRDSLLKSVRENYQAAATKAGETVAYPGNWLYATWSESELKAWCDERGIPVPQPSNRDKLVASVRRNSRIASNNLASWSSAAAASAASATQSLSDALFDTYSDSQLKKWADEKGLKIPQGSKHNEVLALVRRHNARLNSQAASLSSSAASAYGAATSSAGNEYSRATDSAAYNFENIQNAVYSYLDWAKYQVGLAASTASASGSSATRAASKSASNISKSASKSASSISKSASSAASSASKAASSSAQSVKQEL